MKIKTLGAALTMLSPLFQEASPGSKTQDLASRIERMILEVNRKDNLQLNFSGTEFHDLPPEALPLLMAAQQREDLFWTARACLAKGIRKIQERGLGLTWDFEQELRKAEFERLTLGDYRKKSAHDPRWDAPAAEGVEILARFWGALHRGRSEDAYKASALFKTALKAGCDDPLIIFLDARCMLDTGEGTLEERLEAHVKAAAAMRTSPYHPLLKSRLNSACADLLLRVAASKPIPGLKTRVLNHLLDASQQLEQVLQSSPPVLGKSILEQAEFTWDLWARYNDRNQLAAPLIQAAVKALPDSGLPELLAGRFFVQYAWDARGGDWASKVSEQSWKLFHERLKEARKHLSAAWKANPRDRLAPLHMINVTLGDKSPREDMELWFGRGIQAYPDDYGLCINKLNYLEPKWHGDAEAMIQFGRQCVLTGNWEGQIPWVLLDAHLAVAKYSGGGWQAEPDYTYFRNDRAWRDVRTLYAKYLELYPASTAHRASYAFLAGHAGAWKEAYEQFKVLGDTPSSIGMFPNWKDYSKAKAEAARQERKD